MKIRTIAAMLGSFFLTGCSHGNMNPTLSTVGGGTGAILPMVKQTGQQNGWLEFPIPSPVAGHAEDNMVASHDGAVWAVVSSGAMRIDMKGHIQTFTFGTPSYSGPIAANPDGNVYVAEQRGGFFVARIAPGGTITELPIPGSGTPFAMISGSDGNLWITRNYPTSVGRLTLSGDYTDFGQGLYAVGTIVRGADKNLWVFSGTSTGELLLARFSVIDGSETNFSLPGFSCCLTTASDGGLWIPQRNHAAVRFDPFTLTESVFPFPYSLGNSLVIGGPNRLLYDDQAYSYYLRICEYSIDSHLNVRCIKHVNRFSFDGMIIGPDSQLWSASGNTMFVSILHPLIPVPSAVSVAKGDTSNLSVSEPGWFLKKFSAISNNPNIATVNGGPTAFTVTGVLVGSTTITVSDTVGNTLDVPVNVH